MFSVGFDASGSENQPVMCVAGFVSDGESWVHFDPEWRERLAKDGLEYFQMHQFAHSTGQFKDWREDEGRRRKLLADLMAIIQTHTHRKFGVAIIADFMSGLEAENKKAFLMEKLFPIAARSAATRVYKWAQMERFSYRPQLVFEDGDFGKGDLMEGLKQDGWGSPDFRLKKDKHSEDGMVELAFTPLQAADMLAYEYRLAAERLHSSGRFDERWAYLQFEKMLGQVGFYTLKNMEDMNTMMGTLREQEEWAKSRKLPWN